MSQYADEIVGFDDDWVDHPKNVALTNDEGDITLFEWEPTLPGTVCGHFFLFSRGKKAKDIVSSMITYLFNNYDFVDRIAGLTPVNHVRALWMARQLQFTDCGVVDTFLGKHRLSQMTRQQWYNKE